MLHEVLFALLGHTGSIIIEVPEQDAQELSNQMNILDEDGPMSQATVIKFMVNPNLTFLSQAEIDQLNKIVKLGAFFKMILNFLNKFGGISSKLALQLAYKDNAQNRRDKQEDASEIDNSVNGGDNNDEDDDEDNLHGVYMKAFCSGVNEILQVYKQHILAIEHEYIKDRTMTIASLQLRLSIYAQIFPALKQLMDDI